MADIAERVKKLQESKTNLAEKAYREIKNDIIYCNFKPGDHLRENDLAQVLEMSRTPVREALKQLANEGLVEMRRGSGVYVKDITVKDLKDTYELRRALECVAIKTAVINLTPEEIAEQEKIWQDILERVKAGEKVEWEKISRQDDGLHSLIVYKCNNKKLQSFMEVIRQQINRYQFLAALALDDVRITARQHLEIIDLIKNEKDPAKLSAALDEHIRKAEKVIIENVFD